MSTRSCPNCGTQYVATVRRCIDCDANLVDDAVASDEAEAPRTSARPEGRGTQLTYELDGWGNQLKVTLEGMLDRAGVARVWEAGALVVPSVYEAQVDDLIATLEGGEVSDPDDDRPRLALEIEGLDPDRQADLDAQLIASALAHAWDDEGCLVVLEDDEDAVLAIIDAVLDGVPSDEDDGDPLAAQAALSDLFVAVDRLVKKPGDPALVATLSATVDRLAGLAVPYGFSTAAWGELVTNAHGLVELFDQTRSTDPSEATSADGLRTDDDDVSDADADAAADDDEAETDRRDVADQAAERARQLRDQLVDLV